VYPEVHGKVVDFISHPVTDGTLYVRATGIGRKGLVDAFERWLAAIGLFLGQREVRK
jgi:hypothetical protein